MSAHSSTRDRPSLSLYRSPLQPHFFAQHSFGLAAVKELLWYEVEL